MSYKADSFIQDLDQVAKTRQEFAGYLATMATTLDDSEQLDNTSGQLGLGPVIADLTTASQNLSSEVFRLLVLGDMKRGKSTFLNALMGENLLPTDVNPCTAVLTILRYGPEKRVTVHFNDERSPETLSFDAFKERYTIRPDQAKKLEDEGTLAFPAVAYAVVEYPLTLLEKGVEIVDSPGLNDTEARNQLTLNYVNSCHAILFVLSATQQFTLGEQRYLDNYIKDRGLTTFFLINAWDEIQNRLVDPEDATELREAEDRVRQVFRTNLEPYCQLDGEDLYSDRTFEVSSLQALRQRLKGDEGSLEGTGFGEFMQALTTFLTKERAIAELRQAKILARQAYRTTHDAIERRIPLLSHNIDELREKIWSVQPEFDQLVDIRDQFKDEIRVIGERKAGDITTSFRDFLANLDQTFEEDFVRYQPELKFLDFLRKQKREEFEAALKQAFERYLTDKIALWSKDAQRDIDQAFIELAHTAFKHGESYSHLTDQINQKLTGQRVAPRTHLSPEDSSPGWAKWAVGLYALTTGDVGAIAMAGTGLFNWRQVLMNLVGATAITITFALLTDIFLGPIGMALAGLGLSSWTAEQARRKVLATMKAELSNSLPQVAQEQSFVVYQVVKECFETYQQDVVKRMNEDITARKTELSELIKQKESREIDREAETQRLNQLDDLVLAQSHQVEDAYDQVLGIHLPEVNTAAEDDTLMEASPAEQAVLTAAAV
ncbi:dynamin family protein [Nodosilinea sp. LEGE 07088]|uniref:dynamin family protein n=1 Tax=Nodosilinea sp. LEGE 07088 TaxID=2777968 RepID=UPI001880403B|nr:dynamin family protein [Nodosilinea sp. LEGE 07088]MBE9141124.1 dynamin family protein [Nodosilinea sp. LEGE 07088]